MAYTDPVVRREHNRKYREENREKVAEYGRKYREENREKVIEYNRKYREANREEVAEKKRRYYEANHDYVTATARRHRSHMSELNKDAKARAWSMAETELVMRTDLSLIEIASLLGRTYRSVIGRRELERKNLVSK